KTNIGHLEAAAGIVGVIKVLLMLRYKKIPQTLNLKTVNPIIDFKHSPFRLANKLVDWKLHKNQKTRRAGVSSFGFGGVNAHIILEEFQPTEIKSQSSSKLPFILSAKTDESLKDLLREWCQFITTQDFESQSLNDICYTLIQREAFTY